jgi:glucose-1-phosphate adenylyltransferase
VQDSLRLDRDLYGKLGVEGEDDFLLASMGIYVFNRDVLISLLDNDQADFGKHIIPSSIDKHRVFAYIFQGYWEDIGTIGSFFQANLDLVSELPRFNFYDMTSPIFSRPRFLPGSKINGANIDHAMVSDGCIINHADINHSIGIGQHSKIENAIIDKNARIGDHVTISPADKPENLDHPLYCIRDGVVVIPKNGVIPHGMTI